MAEDTDAALQKITKGAGIVFLGTMLQLALAFFAKAIMARFLEVPQYGLVSLGILVLNVGATVSLLGLDKGVSRFLPRYDEGDRRWNVVRLAYQIAVPLSAVIGALIFLFAREISVLIFSDPSLASVLQVMAVGVPFWVLLDLGVGVTRGAENALPRVYGKNILLPGFRFVFVGVVALLGLGVVGMASAYVLSYALASIAISYLVLRRVVVAPDSGVGAREGLGRVFDTHGLRRSLVVFSVPLLFSGMSSFLVRNADLVLLGILRDPSQVAIYNVAYPLARLLMTAAGAFGFLFMPVVSDLHADDRMDEAKRVFQLTAKWLFLLTAPPFVAMVLAPELLIRLSFGAKYDSGGLTLSVLAVGFFVHSLLGLNSNTLTSIGRSRTVMWFQLVSLVLNIALNLLLIPPFGFLGAGIATTVSYVTQNVLYSAALYRYTGIHPFTSSLLRPAAIAGIGGAAVYLIALSVPRVTIPILVGLLLLFALIYLVGVFRFGGIDEEDVRLFNAIEDQTGIDMGAVRRTLRRLIGS